MCMQLHCLLQNPLISENSFLFCEHSIFGSEVVYPRCLCISWLLVDSSWNVMAHGGAREGKWRGNWRMAWVASTLHTTSEHGVFNITTADEHNSAALNSRPRRFKWTRPFRRKTKSGFCVCAIIFQLASSRRTLQCFPVSYVWDFQVVSALLFPQPRHFQAWHIPCLLTVDLIKLITPSSSRNEENVFFFTNNNPVLKTSLCCPRKV